jgi:hypothetical protein
MPYDVMLKEEPDELVASIAPVPDRLRSARWCPRRSVG